jgi:rapamycin-insensitive companion of mTOR
MASMDNSPAYSVTPTQSRVLRGQQDSRKSDEVGNPGLQRPISRGGRSLSGGSTQHGSKGSLQAMSASNAAPGSFSADLKSTNYPRSGTPLPDRLALSASRLQSQVPEDDELTLSKQRQAVFRDKIAKELKIKLGTENMLEALLAKNAKQTKEQRQRVELELGTTNRKLAELRHELEEEIQRAQTPTTPPAKRTPSYLRSSPLKSPSHMMGPDETGQPADAFDGESPTLVLTETLQALEIEGMQPDYYIDRANTLVDLFKRHPTLKYDLAWSVFSLRVQMMLLSESTEVVAAGYRLTRYAIADRASLRTIRSLHTDEIVILSLVKKGKAILEREQAVKFVRAFLDVKDGVFELSRGVIRAIVAVAEHNEDRLKNICILTLVELLMRQPSLLVSAGGISTLTEVLAEGSFPASESLVASFLHILDVPQRRRYLKSGHEFEAMFAPFTDPLSLVGHEDRLKTCIKAISAMLKTWPGLLTLSRGNASALRSLLDSLQYPSPQPKDLILELLFDVLRIKPPSWSTTFLAGRRLTTYGRVTNFVIESSRKRSNVEAEDETSRFDLTSHFSALLLAVLLKAGLLPIICEFILCEEDLALKRKATLLLTEVLKLANHSLPGSISSRLQALPDLVTRLHEKPLEDRSLAASLMYQIESINRTLNRSARPSGFFGKQNASGEILVGQAIDRSKYSALMDSEQFRQAMADTQIPSHSQYIKWKWDLIHSLVEGPLTNVKRLEDAIKSAKFMKRLVGFYRPFKYRFSLIRNTKPNQRYVRTGCALIHTLTQTSLGIQYLAENKLLPQIAECLAQVDRFSGLTSTSPLFDRHQMAETLSGGYFALLGALSQSTNGILIMERWHMINMFYHIIDLKDRNDLIRALLGNMDYSLDSHLRVILSQSLTSGSKEIRLFSTKLLRRYAVDSNVLEPKVSRVAEPHWPLRMLLTQLYDPDVEVCEVAVKILEEACNRRSCLEYVVKCRPSLDHLGEIGAPLLLRFLSTSVGYHYLHGLDYISQEMDDWFLGRNDTYVTLVEASLARAYIDQASQKGTFNDELEDVDGIGLLPPHFYRELARTEEGCRLLRHSGHFYDFASCVRDFKMDEEDLEALTKAKGCLWAIGNVGSMELGAPFLEESEIVGDIVKIAENAEVISMRGTACFVLGLLSRSTHGYEMLREHGWDSAVNSRGQSLGLCMPNDLDRLCSVSQFLYRETQPHWID